MPRNSPAKLALLGVFTLGSCTDYEFYTQQHTDVFQQKQRNTVDVLLVVDNSCSMIEEQVKLASNFNSFIQYFDGVDVDYQISVITTDTRNEEFQGRFLGGDDELVLALPSTTADPIGQVMDRVVYTRDWQLPVGGALSLDPSITSATYNDIRDNWCDAVGTYGDGDLGSPGEENPSCGAEGPEPTAATTDSGDTGSTDDSADTDPQPPVGSEVLISEFLPDPTAVDDLFGEWVELRNTSDRDLDMSGCTLSDTGRNLFAMPEGTVLPANGYLVLARSADPLENGGIDGAVALGEGFTLNNDVRIITPATEGASEIFSEMVAQGISGSGIEMGLEAARMALSEPLLSTENAGFMREDANLSFVFVSDEDDASPWPVDDYLRYFTELKGEDAFRDHTRFKISSVVGDTQPQFEGEPSCSSADGVAAFGSRYVDLSQRTDGLIESICEEDFSPLALELGLVLSGLSAEFALSERPAQDSLVVSLYETADEDSFVRDLVKDEDYLYLVDRNVIRFTEDQVPPSQWYILVSYELLAESAVRDDVGEEG